MEMVNEIEVSGPAEIDFGVEEFGDEDSDFEEADGEDDEDEDDDYVEVYIFLLSCR